MDGATILAVIERPYPLAAEELGLVVEARPTPHRAGAQTGPTGPRLAKPGGGQGFLHTFATSGNL